VGDKSTIEWTDATWNPLVGCSKVSEGCRHCYAMRVAARQERLGQPQYAGLTVIKNGEPQWTGEVRLVEKALELPLRWKKPRRIFVNSMSDLFHESVSREQIMRVFAAMNAAQQHIYQILTKRPQRMMELISDIRAVSGATPPGNWWLGVSVEDQKTADERIPLLLNTPASVRWLSIEPLLGPVGIASWLRVRHVAPGLIGAALGLGFDSRVDWVVVGGESGPNARPMHPQWVRDLRNQCTDAGVPFFFKQWGEWEPSFKFPEQFEGIAPATPCLRLAADGHIGHSIAEMEGHPRHGLMVKTGKKRAGRQLDGREWNEYPQPQAATAEAASL
jgi:protein gp37